MKFLIISHALHKVKDDTVYSYAPYVREMNLWLKYVDSVTIIAPKLHDIPNTIETAYKHKNLKLRPIPAIQFTSFVKALSFFIKTPYILVVIFIECMKTDHIHLRCPGNIGLLGCLVQILFPRKLKTAKYAGNWDPKAKQPLSYKLQKWILRHTVLTKNIQVLVYGEWRNQTKNIKPFFTATYNKSEIEGYKKRNYSKTLNFVYVGSLVNGKQPLFVIQMIEALHKQGKKVTLNLFGEGVLKESLKNYIQSNKLGEIVELQGNQSKENIKESLRKAHFSILPSKSEGWPKAIAEAMFFGVIPVATPVSCVPYMLNHGRRGIIIKGDLNHDLNVLNSTLKDINKLETMSKNALDWSQLFTLDKFDNEISNLIKR